LLFASQLEAADAWMAQQLTPERLGAIVKLIPDAWLEDEPSFASKSAHRDAYLQYLTRRLAAPRAFFEEARRARSAHL
jgi:hypothetical protein